MAEYIEREALDKLIESRKVRGDCKFCAKYERCIANGINRKGSHLYCWEQLKLPTADVVPVVRCGECVAKGKAELEPFVCSRNKMLVYNNCFCSYGKRRCEE